MTAIDPELLAEGASMLLYTLVAVLLTAGGVFAEYSSLQHLGGGDQIVALWLAAFGAILLYAGVYGIGYEKVLTRVVE